MRALILGVLSFITAAPVEHSSTPPLRAPVIEPLHKAAPEFSYRSLDGKMHHLRELKGKAVLINFWGTWCPGCVEEMPKLQRLYANFLNDPHVAFVIVSQNDSPEKVKAYVQKSGLTMPFYYVGSNPPPGVLAAEAWPSTYFVSPDGIVRGVYRGGADWSDPSVSKYIEQLKLEHSVSDYKARNRRDE
jgi:thiol-disulfide isomerase/thioredoxin